MERRISILILLLAPALAAALIPGAAEAGGSRGGTFLPLGWDARGQALGGAATILTRDVSSAYWNPANLVFLTSPGAGIGTTRPIPEMDDLYTVASFGTGLLDTRSSVDGTVEVRRLAVAMTVSHLGLELREGSAWNEGTVGISAGFSFSAYLFAGAGLRMMKSWTDVEDAGSWGSALDFALTSRLSRRIWIAAMIRDLWSKVHYPHSSWEVGPSVVMAISFERLIYGRLSTEFDAVVREGELVSYRIGGELLLIDDALWLQSGADIRRTNGARTIPWLGFTAGLMGARVSLAVGFDPEDDLGRQTRVSASYRF